LKLNNTHQLLVYGDDGNIMGGSVHTVKEKAQALLVASRESGLEVNADKTKVSCKRKKELFVLCKIINKDNLKQYYKKHCRILTKTIRSAKKLHYNNIISRSKNRIKSTWKIINNECGKQVKIQPYHQLN
jgi:hypothetical protein